MECRVVKRRFALASALRVRSAGGPYRAAKVMFDLAHWAVIDAQRG
jgi:hypothetical protein